MNRKKRIESILLKFFKEWNVTVIDNSNEHRGHNNFDGKHETHFKINLSNNSNLMINRLEIHRKINFLLSDEFSNGLHALEIKII